MANSLQRETDSRSHRACLHKISSCCKKVTRHAHHEKRQMRASEKKEWEDAICSVCMDFPHNAVLLLCSSYDKGCRPYMCATSHRFSNCLEQYRKAYTKVTSNPSTESWRGSVDNMDFSEESGWPGGKSETPELLCPLCRGQVKGWTVVEPARRYLNTKKRTCMQDNCSFIGTYKEMKKHVKLEHPLARPRDVDPSHAEKWKKLENERDLSDVFSTIRSTMPGAIVIGDYVIERNDPGISRDYDEDDFLENAIFRFPAYGGSWNGPRFSADSFEGDYDSFNEEYLRRLRARAAVASRSIRRNVSRIARPHARFLFARQAGRFRGGR
ncbi:uncharacterized protein LOC105159499 [Sesamum indicum]|uniref:Uncharacterized protein LOC105159499 n=1 Tax=Sesamum indicum TaxID=4182 RepID=A0A6I9SVZ4_SESIN|nr:uncharacterized protein LOC105159499 [Sesamum indicum]XP_011074881.1 uncharacterized protein LOC105159499 [Sesamum indicum]XP_020548229.1 uncharacterized protein LOC105159499 [Sesamum indicum]